MLFQDDIPQDKGLFTFYKEQQEREQQLKRVKKLGKQAKSQFIQELMQANHSTSLFRPQKHQPAKIQIQQIKPKLTLPKKRLHQSVVDMGQQIDQQSKRSGRHPLGKLKFKEPSFISKTRKYRQKITQFNNSMERDGSLFQEEYIPDQIKIESYHHRRNLSEHLQGSRARHAIHTVKASPIELPQIRKSLDIPSYKPKKSIKSKLIQEALKLKDKEKIKNIRQCIKASSNQQPQLQIENMEEIQVDSCSFAVFQQHQQKILGIIKKFRRGRQ